ncbi:MAG: hypothetical protein IPF42_06345 [Candidatus Microthrix sp.]|nr:hypothetical protein [Candidatus Microthrix sp.]
MLSGEAVVRARSPFYDRLGEEVAASSLTLVVAPTDPDSLGAEEYDGEGPGLPPQRADLRRHATRLTAQLHDRQPPRGVLQRLR